MASFTQIPRHEKKRIASELHDNFAARADQGPADTLLDPFIAKFAGSRDSLVEHVEGKSTALAQRAAVLSACDVADDEVDRWYRHLYRFIEVESIRRHNPHQLSISGLISAAYPDGLEHVDDRIPDQNEQVRRALIAFRDSQFADTLKGTALPLEWLENLDSAMQQSDSTFAAYQATFSDAATAVSLGRDAEAEWVQLARGVLSAIELRAMDGGADSAAEGKRLVAPLTDAIRKLRTESRTRATKRKNEGA